jgi:hypothetical protein
MDSRRNSAARHCIKCGASLGCASLQRRTARMQRTSALRSRPILVGQARDDRVSVARPAAALVEEIDEFTN